MRSTAVALDVQENLRTQVSQATEPFLVRLLWVLVASHEFSLLMPDHDGALTASYRKARPDLVRKAPRSRSCGVSASPGMSS